MRPSASACGAGLLASAFFLALAPGVIAQDKAIDTQHSTITIHVGNSGLPSAAAHDHTVEAPISSGTLRPDPKVDPKTELTPPGVAF